MLKGALPPHVNDYRLEVKYSKDDDSMSGGDGDDFEIIEKVADSLKVKLDLGEQKKEETVSADLKRLIRLLTHTEETDLTLRRFDRPRQGGFTSRR